ncbi:unnamed protein product [Brassica oleracea var. botrytis]|uniref:Uncharacterized protein n=1 Tax=Brassica oleracea var. oleracea TaxID=109376 RepID=A0A0D3C3U8_BRAOL|nr:PREDICTED: exopolygalacturonase [Brassica oleracea var. oleracea]
MASRFLILCISSLFLFYFFLVISSAQTNAFHDGQKVFDVRNYGARGDGKTNTYNALAFTKAWNEACEWSGGRSTVYIPAGTFYLDQIMFSGPCKRHITFTIKGTLLAPRILYADKRAEWLAFRYVDNLTVNGGGILDGQGSYSWRHLNDCDKNPNCRALAMNIGFSFVRSARVNGLRSINSKMGHFNLYAVENFNITGVKITAPEDSPNTDGIKIGRSKDMHIFNVSIGTGDDCVAILDGTTNLDISNVRCGPGHGISVGSIGRFKDEKSIEGITVRNSVLKGTMNGLRIKTWAKSASETSVSKFLFEDIQMINVRNPIVIDQQYCPHNLCDSPGKYNSHVQIKDVKYTSIWGTSATQAALMMQCSKTFPCQGVELSDINLVYKGRDGSVTATCENVAGSVHGKIVPGGCRI